MDPLDTLIALRPHGRHLDDATSARLLRQVVEAPPHRRNRRRVWIAGIGVAAVLTGGAAAAGGGLVPGFVAERFQDMRGEDGANWPDPITNERLAVSIPLSNGRTARVWHADTENGFCMMRDMTDRVKEPGDLGVGCGTWDNLTAGELFTFAAATHWQRGPNGPAVVYGDLSWPDWPAIFRTIQRVIVVGPGWRRTLDVANSHTFGAEIPAEPEGTIIKYQFLDENGELVGASTETVSMECSPEVLGEPHGCD